MLLCGSGFYISWYISVQCIYNSQRNIISSSSYKNESVVAFAFSKKDLSNHPEITLDDDELEYKQQMFDIINIKTSGDSIYLNCIADNDEDNLKQIIAGQILNSNHDFGKQLSISHFHIDDYINQLKNYNDLSANNNLIRTNHILFNVGILRSQFLSKPSPPPWFKA